MNGARIVHLPPVGIRLPLQLRRVVNKLGHRQPHRHARLERLAAHLWLEFGVDTALQRLNDQQPRSPTWPTRSAPST